MSELVSDAMVDAYLLTLDGELPTRDPGFDAKFIRAREFLEKLVRASPELSLSLAREQRTSDLLLEAVRQDFGTAGWRVRVREVLASFEARE